MWTALSGTAIQSTSTETTPAAPVWLQQLTAIAYDGAPYDTELRTPVIDPATLADLTLRYKVELPELFIL